jgi:alcohol dehydrogenase
MPAIVDPTDPIARVTRTTICGTDLHILKGDVPSCEPGRILGHEGVGVIHEAGSAVSSFKVGDHVLISCISSCGRCKYCRRGMYSHCTTGGWILGNRIDGTQAEYVRIPHAETSLYPISAGADEEALVMVSDILPTCFECGVLNGKVEPGSTVAIVGSGPIGLAALLTAQFYSPAQIIMIDRDTNRLEVAQRFGATGCIDIAAVDPVEALMKLTDGLTPLPQANAYAMVRLIRLKSTRDGCDWTRSSARQVPRVGYPHIADMSAPHNLVIAFERSTLKAR